MVRDSSVQTMMPLFGEEWFGKHQRLLLWLLNAPIVRLWFRWCLRIRRCDCPTRICITQIGPNRFSWGDEWFRKDGQWYLRRTTDFRTHAKYAKRLYYAFRPVWWAMHAWDWFVADRVAPALSWGFSTLTAYPQAGGGGSNVTCDGYIYTTSSPDTWANLVARANGDSASTTAVLALVEMRCYSTTNLFDIIWRSYFSFDTSALTEYATISAASIWLYGYAKGDGLSCAPDIDIYLSTQANANTLVLGDFSKLGTVSQTGAPITYTNFSISGYNELPLSATGIGNISKTGVSAFGARNANYDAANTPPNWVSLANSYLEFFAADRTGTTQDPKLVITYTTTTEEFIPQIQII